jgi:hypothetical protein
MEAGSSFRKGQIGFIATLVIATLLGVIGLGADVGVLYYHWGQLQKAADSAVLAGANYLPGNPDLTKTKAKQFATLNGILDPSEIVSTDVASDKMSVTMVASRSVPYSFLRALGLTSGSVTTTATAGPQPNTELGRGLIPIGLSCPGGSCAGSYLIGTDYQLAQGGGNGNNAWNLGPGNWGRLGLGDHGASQFLNNLELGYQGSMNVNGMVDAEQGQVNGPTNTGISDRITLGQSVDGNPTVTSLANAPAYDPRLVAVPMIDFTGAKGNSASVQVVDFAMMWLNSYNSQGSNKYIDAIFLGTVAITNVSSTIQTFGGLSTILSN